VRVRSVRVRGGCGCGASLNFASADTKFQPGQDSNVYPGLSDLYKRKKQKRVKEQKIE